MHAPAPQEGYVRAGDAVVACDPLSGHGLYEALRSAGLATAAIHTHLTRNTRDAWAGIAQFLGDASRELWNTALSGAAAFYASQAALTPTPFWVETARAYAALQPRPVARAACRIECRPVLNGPMIEMRAVVVTAERPRGVWQVDSVDLVGLVRFLHEEPTAGIERAALRFGRQPGAIVKAVHWLTTHGLLKRA
jgi:hypothetical protein